MYMRRLLLAFAIASPACTTAPDDARDPFGTGPGPAEPEPEPTPTPTPTCPWDEVETPEEIVAQKAAYGACPSAYKRWQDVLAGNPPINSLGGHCGGGCPPSETIYVTECCARQAFHECLRAASPDWEDFDRARSMCESTECRDAYQDYKQHMNDAVRDCLRGSEDFAAVEWPDCQWDALSETTTARAEAEATRPECRG